jgi:NDP-sugar pyrophosphorylase family protein
VETQADKGDHNTTFQAMMDDYFRDMIDEGWIAIYMDDILIHARTTEDLEKRMKQVLQRLKEHNLYLKPEKCKFKHTEVEFLGTIISENTIQMDLTKLAGIRDWPPPTTVKQTQSFLGFGNYYQRFISGFAEIA